MKSAPGPKPWPFSRSMEFSNVWMQRHSEQASLSGLTQDGCEARRSRLITALTAEGFDAALLVHPGHISAFSGHWTRGLFCSLLLVVADGNAILATPVKPVEPAFVTHTIVFPGRKTGNDA